MLQDSLFEHYVRTYILPVVNTQAEKKRVSWPDAYNTLTQEIYSVGLSRYAVYMILKTTLHTLLVLGIIGLSVNALMNLVTIPIPFIFGLGFVFLSAYYVWFALRKNFIAKHITIPLKQCETNYLLQYRSTYLPR